MYCLPVTLLSAAFSCPPSPCDQSRRVSDQRVRECDHEGKACDQRGKASYHERRACDHERRPSYHERKACDHGRRPSYHERRVCDHGRRSSYHERRGFSCLSKPNSAPSCAYVFCVPPLDPAAPLELAPGWRNGAFPWLAGGVPPPPSSSPSEGLFCGKKSGTFS